MPWPTGLILETEAIFSCSSQTSGALGWHHVSENLADCQWHNTAKWRSCMEFFPALFQWKFGQGPCQNLSWKVCSIGCEHDCFAGHQNWIHGTLPGQSDLGSFAVATDAIDGSARFRFGLLLLGQRRICCSGVSLLSLSWELASCVIWRCRLWLSDCLGMPA